MIFFTLNFTGHLFRKSDDNYQIFAYILTQIILFILGRL